MSSMVVTTASGFAEHLIRRFGLSRYRSLLRLAREGSAGTEVAFTQAYHRPLSVIDRDWRRYLEASARHQQPSALATIRRLLPLLVPYWWSGIVILLYALIGIGFSLALPLTFRFLIDDLLGHRPLARTIPFVGSSGHVITAGNEQLRILLGLLVLLAAFYVLNAVARLRMVVVLNNVGESFVLDMRRQLLDVLSRLPATYFARTTIADVSQRVVYDTTSIQQALTNALMPLVTGGLSIAMNAVVLVTLDARLALVAMIGLPLLGLMYRLRRRNLRAAARERARRISSLSARVGEMASMQMLIKIYGAAAFFVGRMGRQLEIHRHLNLAYAREAGAGAGRGAGDAPDAGGSAAGRRLPRHRQRWERSRCGRTRCLLPSPQPGVCSCGAGRHCPPGSHGCGRRHRARGRTACRGAGAGRPGRHRDRCAPPGDPLRRRQLQLHASRPDGPSGCTACASELATRSPSSAQPVPASRAS